jgi:hypothetical protein
MSQSEGAFSVTAGLTGSSACSCQWLCVLPCPALLMLDDGVAAPTSLNYSQVSTE